MQRTLKSNTLNQYHVSIYYVKINYVNYQPAFILIERVLTTQFTFYMSPRKGMRLNQVC